MWKRYSAKIENVQNVSQSKEVFSRHNYVWDSVRRTTVVLISSGRRGAAFCLRWEDNFITLRIPRSDGNVTHSLNPWLTHSPLLLKTQTFEFASAMFDFSLITRWWFQRNLASPQAQGGLKKRESPSCQIFYSSLKTDYFDKVTDVF